MGERKLPFLVDKLKKVFHSSFMNPFVKTWKVSFIYASGNVLTTTVRTINKRFAKLSANEAFGNPIERPEKITVSVVKS
jgi:hypothetical protein